MTRWSRRAWSSRSGSSPTPTSCLKGSRSAAPGPDTRYEARESIELAFMVALQALPPRQRAVLVLCDVLGFRLAEAAEMLDTGEIFGQGRPAARPCGPERATTGRRPRACPARRLRQRAPAGGALRRRGRERRGRRAGRPAHRRRPARDSPCPLEYQGRDAIGAFLCHREEVRGRPLRVVPTRANTQPAFGCSSPTRRVGSRTLTHCSCLPSKATAFPPSPGSATTASSRTSGCRGRAFFLSILAMDRHTATVAELVRRAGGGGGPCRARSLGGATAGAAGRRRRAGRAGSRTSRSVWL